MNRTIPNILTNCKRYFLVFATFLLVLLTSCSIKSSIKIFAGLPTQTESGFPKTHQSFPTSSLEKCSKIETADNQIVQNFNFKANDFLPVLLFTASFLFLIGFCPLNKENKHPLYSGSNKIRSSIPIFLEYRKLIIHFAR